MIIKTCLYCGKKFEGTRCVTVDYRTEMDCRLNGEECEAGEYHCKKCDSYDLNVKQKLKNDSLEKEKENKDYLGEEILNEIESQDDAVEKEGEQC